MIEKISIKKLDKRFIVKTFGKESHSFVFNSFDNAMDYINKIIDVEDEKIAIYHLVMMNFVFEIKRKKILKGFNKGGGNIEN